MIKSDIKYYTEHIDDLNGYTYTWIPMNKDGKIENNYVYPRIIKTLSGVQIKSKIRDEFTGELTDTDPEELGLN